MANTCVVNLNADLVSLGGGDLDVLDGEVLASLPGNGSLAGDGLLSCAPVSLLFIARWRAVVISSWRAGPMEG